MADENKKSKREIVTLKFPMKILEIMIFVTLFFAVLYWFTKNKIILGILFASAFTILALYLYIAVHIIYKYYWYFNSGKIKEDRDLDLGFVTQSSIIAIIIVVFAFAGLFSLFAISSTGELFVTYLPEEYASLIFGFIPTLVLGLCLFCIILFVYFSMYNVLIKNIHMY